MQLDISLERQQGRPSEIVASEPVAAAVRKRFRRFLRTFADEKGEVIYPQQIERMVQGACE